MLKSKRLKWKRLVTLDILAMKMSFGGPITSAIEEAENVRGLSINLNCKRGRKEAMGDHFSAVYFVLLS